TPGADAQAIAMSLLYGERKAVLLGNAAAQHPQAGALLALAHWIAAQTGASVGYLSEAANSVGAQLVGARPLQGGLDAGQMLTQGMKALLLLHTEPVLDAADAAGARAALQASGLVVALTAFKDAAVDNADVLLPVAPFSETAGSFVNAEGRLQSFHGVVRPLGDTRPGWKVLRVLGNLLGLDGFEHESAEDVRAEALGDPAALAPRLDNTPPADALATTAAAAAGAALQRVAEVPIYATDMLVRRAESLQLTADARPPVVGLPSALWQGLGLKAGGRVLVQQGTEALILPAREEPTLAVGCVRVPAGHPDTSKLGAMFGDVAVEKV
ncbi:MAG TPA: molybdopterin-dependent oxidoreductase, partial [Rubrivivax sp.]|nr:molybdopterin-dependent oxidoreductase [Rubrivivax sp.]